MKSLRFILLPACILMLCVSGNSLFALPMADGSSQAVTIFSGTLALAIVTALFGCYLFNPERKARVLIPIKTQRPEKPTVIRHRRNHQW